MILAGKVRHVEGPSDRCHAAGMTQGETAALALVAQGLTDAEMAPAHCRAHLLRILREHRGSYLTTGEIQALVRDAGQGYAARPTLEALHVAGSISKMQQGRKQTHRLRYLWAVPA